MLVRQLIDDSGGWSTKLICNSFVSEVIEAILQIVPMHGQDTLVWKFERIGNYFVASGYNIAFKFFHPPTDAYPIHLANKELWKSVWTLRSPPKIKLLIWILLHDGVSMRQKLISRSFDIDDSCPWCLEVLEFIFHYIVSCPHTKVVLRLAGLGLQRWNSVASMPFQSQWTRLNHGGTTWTGRIYQ